MESFGDNIGLQLLDLGAEIDAQASWATNASSAGRFGNIASLRPAGAQKAGAGNERRCLVWFECIDGTTGSELESVITRR
ncbi:MAG: hypothetical protein R3F19_18700 [Verrucomicrobiales bacterium]